MNGEGYVSRPAKINIGYIIPTDKLDNIILEISRMESKTEIHEHGKLIYIRNEYDRMSVSDNTKSCRISMNTGYYIEIFWKYSDPYG